MSKILLANQSAAPDTPAAGKTAIFTKSGGLYIRKDDGSEYAQMAAPGSPSAGDILYWNGSAWTSLALGTQGHVLQAGASAPEYAELVVNPAPAIIAEATDTVETFSDTDVLMPDMTITPGAGKYLVIGSAMFRTTNGAGFAYLSIYSNGTQVAASERYVTGTATFFECSSLALVTVADSQDIEVRWRDSGPGNAEANNRQLLVHEVS